MHGTTKEKPPVGDEVCGLDRVETIKIAEGPTCQGPMAPGTSAQSFAGLAISSAIVGGCVGHQTVPLRNNNWKPDC